MWTRLRAAPEPQIVKLQSSKSITSVRSVRMKCTIVKKTVLLWRWANSVYNCNVQCTDCNCNTQRCRSHIVHSTQIFVVFISQSQKPGTLKTHEGTCNSHTRPQTLLTTATNSKVKTPDAFPNAKSRFQIWTQPSVCKYWGSEELVAAFTFGPSLVI